MKKIIFTVIFAAAFTSAIRAQKTDTSGTNNNLLQKVEIKGEPKFYLNVHAGYAFGLGSTFKFYPDNVSSIQVTQVGNNSPSKKTIYGSPTRGLGEGFRYGVGASYIVNDFINVGVDLDYFKSTISKNRDSSFSQTQIPMPAGGADSYSYNQRITTSYDASLLTISPNVTFKAISRPKWFLYNKIGAVVTFRPNSIQNTEETVNARTGWQNFYKDSATRNKTTFEWGIKNPAFGFMAGIGAQFRLTSTIRFFSELQFSHVVFVVRKRTITDFNVDGKNMLASLPISVREIQFRTSYTEYQTNQQDNNAPSQAITERIPITYVGVQAGFSYRF